MLIIILRTIQVFVALGLIGVVLLQRSEGGGLGIGSSGGAGAFMSVRGTANFLTRVTAVLAGTFMVICLILALLAKPNAAPKSIFDSPSPASTNQPVPTAPATPAPLAPVPASEAPAQALPVPLPGEKPESGVTTSPAPVAPSTPPAAMAPAKPKAPTTGAAHTPGQ